MAVYVDDMELPADVPNGDKVVSSNWSHLVADTHEELMAAARALHLSPKWIQDPGTAKEHFDLTSGKRTQAIKQEIAEPITWRQSGELYAAKVQQEQARQEAGRVRDEPAAQLDYQAGCAFREGDLDKARAVLAEAALKYPEERDLWASRLDQIEAVARTAEPEAPHAPVPPVGIHRDGGTTTRGTYGTFERAPDPGPEHQCPSCTTETERDGKLYVHGPKIEAHQDQCQGCQVDASAGSRPAPAHDVPRADRSDPEKPCGKCGTPGVGPGGIICPPCRDDIESRTPGREPAVTVQPERDQAEAAGL